MGSDRLWLGSQASSPSSRSVGLALCAIALGAALRLDGVAERFLNGDELHTLELSRQHYAAILANLDPRIGAGGIALPLLQRVAGDVFGPAVWAFRLPAIAGGLLALLLIFPVARRLCDAPVAALATAALALNPVHVFYSQFARAYALACAVVLLLVYALLRAGERRRGVLWYGVAAGCVALAPWVHLTSLASVGCAVAGAAAKLWVERRNARDLLPLLASVALGLAGALVLYLPAWSPLLHMLGIPGARQAEVPVSMAFDVAVRFAGSPVAAVFWLTGGLASAAFFARARPRMALLLLPVALGPILYLAVSTPRPGVYTYVRYLLATLPFQIVLLSWGCVAVLRALLASFPARDAVAVAVGLVAVAAAHVFGPLGLRLVDDGPYASGYHRMYEKREEMNRPFPGTPGFYAELAREDATVRIIEAPRLSGFHLNLYRNYYLQHRKRSGMGSFRPGLPDAWPYVDLLRPASLSASSADYLIVHLDVDAELRRNLGRDRGGHANPLHFAVGEGGGRHALARRLGARLGLGEPAHESEDLAVWRLR